MRSHKEKDPRRLLMLALEGEEIRLRQGDGAFEAWKAKQPEWWHEAHPGQVVVDLVERLITLAKLPCVWTYMHLMPRTGRGTLREIRKLTRGNAAERDDQLRVMLERGLIHPGTKRKDLDDIRSAQKMPVRKTEVAARHRGQRT